MVKTLSFVGGKLEISKYGFYVLQRDFDSKEKPIPKENKWTIKFTFHDIRIESKRLQTKESLMYICVTFQPNNDQSAQSQVLIKKIKKVG